MRNFDETNLTGAVLERVSQGTSPRLGTISQALVRHLHAFVTEIEPTQEEWAAAIAFLTRTGQTYSETRQEFVLLSDKLPPLAARRGNVEHRVDDLAQIGRTRTPKPVLGVHEGRDQRPFRVSQIACMA